MTPEHNPSAPNPNKKKYHKNEIRLRYIPEKLVEELTNIADHKGITLTTYLKGKLREARDSEPQHYLQPLPR